MGRKVGSGSEVHEEGESPAEKTFLNGAGPEIAEDEGDEGEEQEQEQEIVEDERDEGEEQKPEHGLDQTELIDTRQQQVTDAERAHPVVEKAKDEKDGVDNTKEEKTEGKKDDKTFSDTPKPQPPVVAKRSACGVLCSVIKFGCKVTVGLIMGTMAYECMAKVSLGVTNAVSDLLYKQSLEHYTFDYNMRVSSVLDSASHWLINPNNQPERMAASTAIFVVGLSVLAYEAYTCYSSRCKAEKAHTAEAVIS